MNFISDSILKTLSFANDPILSKLPVLSADQITQTLAQGITQSWSLEKITDHVFQSLPKEKQTPEIKNALAPFLQKAVQNLATKTPKDPKQKTFTFKADANTSGNQTSVGLKGAIIEANDAKARMKFATVQAKAETGPGGVDVSMEACLLDFSLDAAENSQLKLKGLCGKARLAATLSTALKTDSDKNKGFAFKFGGELFSIGDSYSIPSDDNCHYKIDAELDILGAGAGIAIDPNGGRLKFGGPVGFELGVHKICSAM